LDQLAEAFCISTITLGGLLYGVEKSARRSQNLQAVEQLTARQEVLRFSAKAAAQFGQIRAGLAEANSKGSRDFASITEFRVRLKLQPVVVVSYQDVA
jgi:predicted nucleic acid-binding protein